MQETYWEHFMATGRISDYLNYKMGNNCIPDKNAEDDTGKEQCESDRTDRNGAVHDAGR